MKQGLNGSNERESGFGISFGWEEISLEKEFFSNNKESEFEWLK